MNRLFFSTALLLLVPLSASAQQSAAEGQSPKPGFLKWFKQGGFATLQESQGTYQVRVMTKEQKEKAETLREEYAKQREAYTAYVTAIRSRDRGALAPADGAPAPDPPEPVERPSIAADLAGGAFLEVVDVASDYVELKSGDTHVVLPVASIRVILLGEKGGLSSTTRPSAFTGREGFSRPGAEEFGPRR